MTGSLSKVLHTKNNFNIKEKEGLPKAPERCFEKHLIKVVVLLRHFTAFWRSDDGHQEFHRHRLAGSSTSQGFFR